MADLDGQNGAVGLLEVFGLVCAFMAADAGCKAGNVTLEIFDKNKPANAETLPVPLLVTVKFRGKVDDVREALSPPFHPGMGPDRELDRPVQQFRIKMFLAHFSCMNERSLACSRMNSAIISLLSSSPLRVSSIRRMPARPLPFFSR